MSVNAPTFTAGPSSSVWPGCGNNITEPWFNSQPVILDYQKPPLGYAAWMARVSPGSGYTLSENTPVQMRLLNAPLPNPIQGQKLTWDGSWLTFTQSGFFSADVSGPGDVLFLPMQPSRDYTLQARQVDQGGAGQGLQVYSAIVECTVHVGFDLTNAGISLHEMKYRVTQ